jgi:hypothetical protein
MQLSRTELAHALSHFVDSIPEFPEIGAETPFEQTVQLRDGRYVQLIVMEADKKIFDREESEL